MWPVLNVDAFYNINQQHSLYSPYVCVCVKRETANSPLSFLIECVYVDVFGFSCYCNASLLSFSGQCVDAQQRVCVCAVKY